MTRYEVELNLDIISAYAEGKDIQYRGVTGWRTLDKDEELNMEILKKEPDNFRINPKSKYRPFKDAEECWNEMLKHQPIGWVKFKTGSYHFINDVAPCDVFTANNWTSYKEMYNDFTFDDGTPFGIKEEE